MALITGEIIPVKLVDGVGVAVVVITVLFVIIVLFLSVSQDKHASPVFGEGLTVSRRSESKAEDALSSFSMWTKISAESAIFLTIDFILREF